MSGQGNPPQNAPARTIGSLLLSEPAITSGGYLTTWFAQFLTRLSGYVGPADGSGTTITNQTISLTQALLRTLGTQGIDGATLARVQGLEDAAAPLLPMALDAGSSIQALSFLPETERNPAPLASLEPWLTEDSIVPSGPTVIYAPLVNGDLPGPTLMANGQGACIMVPIT